MVNLYKSNNIAAKRIYNPTKPPSMAPTSISSPPRGSTAPTKPPSRAPTSNSSSTSPHRAWDTDPSGHSLSAKKLRCFKGLMTVLTPRAFPFIKGGITELILLLGQPSRAKLYSVHSLKVRVLSFCPRISKLHIQLFIIYSSSLTSVVNAADKTTTKTLSAELFC